MAQEAENSWAGCLGVVLLVAIGWLLFSNSPISWYFCAALAAIALLTWLSKKTGEIRDRHPTFLAKLLHNGIGDGRQFCINLTIGFGLVFSIQVALNFFGGNPNEIGTTEQRVWDALHHLKDVGTIGSVLGLAAAALLLSAILGTWLPLVLTGKLRKIVSTLAAILASGLMFSFVTADVAEKNAAAASAGIHAQLLSTFSAAAKARREAAAYQWVATVIAAMPRERSAAMGAYLHEGLAKCRDFNQRMADASQSEDRENPIGILNRRFVPSCDESKLARILMQRLLPVGSEEPSVTANWLPEFKDEIQPKQSEYGQDAFDLREKFRSIELWRLLLAKAKQASTDAEAGRATMRGALAKILTSQMNDSVLLGETGGLIVDTFRDAAIGLLGKEGEKTIQIRLKILAAGTSPSADLSKALLSIAFPERSFAKGPILDPAERSKAEQEAFAESTPQAQSALHAADTGRFSEFLESRAQQDMRERRSAERMEAVREMRSRAYEAPHVTTRP